MEESFSNPNPLVHSESKAQRESFNRVAALIKEGYAQQGKPISNQEAIEAAHNLIGYIELAMEIATHQEKDAAEYPLKQI